MSLTITLDLTFLLAPMLPAAWLSRLPSSLALLGAFRWLDALLFVGSAALMGLLMSWLIRALERRSSRSLPSGSGASRIEKALAEQRSRAASAPIAPPPGAASPKPSARAASPAPSLTPSSGAAARPAKSRSSFDLLRAWVALGATAALLLSLLSSLLR